MVSSGPINSADESQYYLAITTIKVEIRTKFQE
jgi:hypothetical protein